MTHRRVDQRLTEKDKAVTEKFSTHMAQYSLSNINRINLAREITREFAKLDDFRTEACAQLLDTKLSWLTYICLLVPNNKERMEVFFNYLASRNEREDEKNIKFVQDILKIIPEGKLKEEENTVFHAVLTDGNFEKELAETRIDRSITKKKHGASKVFGSKYGMGIRITLALGETIEQRAYDYQKNALYQDYSKRTKNSGLLLQEIKIQEDVMSNFQSTEIECIAAFLDYKNVALVEHSIKRVREIKAKSSYEELEKLVDLFDKNLSSVAKGTTYKTSVNEFFTKELKVVFEIKKQEKFEEELEKQALQNPAPAA